MVIYLKRRGIKYFMNNFDWTVFVPALLCSIFGIVLIYSASRVTGAATRDVFVQSVALVLGLTAMAVLCWIDYDVLDVLGWVIGALGAGALVLVLLIGTGGEEVGTQG